MQRRLTQTWIHSLSSGVDAVPFIGRYNSFSVLFAVDMSNGLLQTAVCSCPRMAAHLSCGL